SKFADIAREGVEAHGGEVIELRGDEALAVFTSAREAVRSAVALQQVYADELDLDPGLPLAVGIGLDAGEAVPVDGGYRGGALNLAARLCSLAGPGEVLVSPGVARCASRGSRSPWRSSPCGPSARTSRAISRSAARSIPLPLERSRRATRT